MDQPTTQTVISRMIVTGRVRPGLLHGCHHAVLSIFLSTMRGPLFATMPLSCEDSEQRKDQPLMPSKRQNHGGRLKRPGLCPGRKSPPACSIPVCSRTREMPLVCRIRVRGDWTSPGLLVLRWTLRRSERAFRQPVSGPVWRRVCTPRRLVRTSRLLDLTGVRCSREPSLYAQGLGTDFRELTE